MALFLRPGGLSGRQALRYPDDPGGPVSVEQASFMKSGEAAEKRADLCWLNDLHQSVIDALPQHLAILDQRGIIVAVNRAWVRFAMSNGAKSIDSVGVGANYLDICQACSKDCDDAMKVSAGIRGILSGDEQCFQMEYPCDSQTEKRWFLLDIVPLSGPIRGAVMSHMDITRRYNDEQRLQWRAAELARVGTMLKRRNEELDQFAYVTSHDLKAPLRGIANLSRWIEEDLGQNFTADARTQMELLRGRVARMEALIDGLLQYSRAGRTKLKVEKVDVGKLLTELVAFLSPAASVKIEIVSPMPTIEAEVLPLTQVFQNLIGNAIKHNNSPEPRVTVNAQLVDDQFFQFHVTDNGPGIDPRFHEKIFVIFQTLEARDRVEGTGIGLTIVQKLVEHAGGKITVRSNLGQGSTFSFTWPARPLPDAPARLDGEVEAFI
jgi:signal transduction histidine kinase